MAAHIWMTIRTILGIIGNVTSGCLFISPAVTVYRVYKNKSVEGFHPYPYLAALMNCLMWVFYAMPFVHPHSILVMTINGTGIALELAYLSVFFYYSPGKERLKMLGVLAIEAVMFGGIIAGTMLGAHTTDKRSMIVGSLCVVFGVILYASPLSVLMTVVKTKSAEFLPGWLIASGFANGIVWALYALIRFDLFILLSNGIGAFLAVVQIFFKFKYRNGPKQEEGKKQSEVEIV